MIAFNNLAVIVAFTFLLTSTLGAAAPAPSPDNAVNNVDIGRRLVDSIGAMIFKRGEPDPDDVDPSMR